MTDWRDRIVEVKRMRVRDILGRRARAVEISPGYVAMALERWSAHANKTPVLVD